MRINLDPANTEAAAAPTIASTDSAPAAAPTVIQIKPGCQTTECWGAFLVIALGAVQSTGLVDAGSSVDHWVGMVVAALTALGYANIRTAHKTAVAQANAGN